MAIKKLLPFIITILLLITAAVTAQGSEKQRTKMEEVMVTHDQVMDRMPHLVKLIGQLETRTDASYEKQKYRDAIKDLKTANKSMMDWMTGFGNRFEADEMYKGKTLTEQKQRWLLQEEKKVTDLQEEIDLSIRQGEKLLQP